MFTPLPPSPPHRRADIRLPSWKRSRRRTRAGTRVVPQVNDGAVDDDEEGEGPPRPLPKSNWRSTYRWWTDEYRLAAVCVVVAIALGIVFAKLDNQLVPQLGHDFDFDVIIVAMFTCVRVAMSGIVESHLACIGALIVILVHGLEASSQQFYRYEPVPVRAPGEGDEHPSPAPPRSEFGILSVDVVEIEPECLAENCTWPLMPTLAVCGECNTVSVEPTCSDRSQSCLYTMESGTSLDMPHHAPSTERFKVTNAPPGSDPRFDETSRTFISTFDVLWVMKNARETKTSGHECALWFCIKSYKMTMTNGRYGQNMLDPWNKTRYEPANSAHNNEYAFVDVPDEMGTANRSRYSISEAALFALRAFVDPLIPGTYEKQFGIINFSSEWIEGIYNAHLDLPTWIRRFSTSLTNEVRLHGQDRSKEPTDYNGFGYKMQQQIIVSWLWMMFPTIMIVVSIYYLVHTIIKGARDGISVWKSDSLPMLFCRIDPSILARVGDGMDVPNGLDDRVGEVKVCLMREEDGDWVFKPIESEASSSSSSSSSDSDSD
ncbi:arginase family protein [Colletotrichum musicola]|uniref:Arginase family protein n=1 Tax=Colletotrichum musicola TaxID=2175873 RepID=A0A8H6NXF8_9PEZI|nr:arginase family protein [Colletotrichum musicola]